MKKKWLIILLAVLVLIGGIGFLFLRSSNGTLVSTEYKPLNGSVDLEGMQKQSVSGHAFLENNRYSLDLDNATGQFLLTEKASGKTWHSNPEKPEADLLANGLGKQWLQSQLIVQYYNAHHDLAEVTSQTASVKKNGLSVYSNGEAICCCYYFTKEDFEICVVYRLTAQGLSVTIPYKNLKESGDCKISTVKLLPYFASVGANEKGYLFVPDGCGAVIELTKQDDHLSKLQYEKPIYGRDSVLSTKVQSANKEDLLFPVFASCGQQGVIGTVTEGDAISSLQVVGEGFYTGYSAVAPICTVRSRDTIALYEDTINERPLAVFQEKIGYKGNFTVCYAPMAESFTYADIARKTVDYYNTFATGKSTDPGKNRLYLQTVGVTQKTENRFGVLQDVDFVLTNAEQVTGFINRLKAAGVSEQTVLYYGMFGSGDYTVVPTKGQFNRSVIKKGWNDLLNCGAAIVPMIDSVRVYRAGNGVSLSANVCRGVHGTKAVVSPIAQNTGEIDKKSRKSFSVMCPTYLNGIYDKMYDSFKKQKVTCFGDMGLSVLSSDFSKTDEISRQDSLECYKEILKKNAERYERNVAERFYGYMLPYVTDIVNLPAHSSMVNGFTYDVPFAQLVISQFADYSADTLNEVSTDEKAVLKMLEYHCNPSYRVMATQTTDLRNTYLQDETIGNFDVYFDQITDTVKRFDMFAQTASGGLTDHKRLAVGVYQSTYENGAKVIFNYNDVPVTVQGIRVDAVSYAYVR